MSKMDRHSTTDIHSLKKETPRLFNLNFLKSGSYFFGQCSHSCATSCHFKICKWKGEEFLFWASVFPTPGAKGALAYFPLWDWKAYVNTIYSTLGNDHFLNSKMPNLWSAWLQSLNLWETSWSQAMTHSRICANTFASVWRHVYYVTRYICYWWELIGMSRWLFHTSKNLNLLLSFPLLSQSFPLQLPLNLLLTAGDRHVAVAFPHKWVSQYKYSRTSHCGQHLTFLWIPHHCRHFLPGLFVFDTWPPLRWGPHLHSCLWGFKVTC